MKLITHLLISIFIACGLLVPLGATVHAAFDPFGTACEQVKNSEKPPACTNNGKDPITGAEGEGILIKATRLVSMVVGVAAVIAIIMAGIEYITSSGDPKKIENAKNIILYALIGLGIAAVAQILLTFVISQVA